MPVELSSRSADLYVGLAQAGFGCILGGLGASLVLLARDLGVARGELAWLSAGFGASLVVVGGAGAWLLRVGAGVVLRVCAGILVLGTATLATTPSLLFAKAGALVLGIGGAGIVLATPALLSGRRAAARLATVTAAAMLAGVCGPVLLSLVDAATGMGRLGLLVPLPALLWVAWHPTTSTQIAADAATGAARPPEPASLLRVALEWLCVVLAVVPEFACHVWGASRLQDSGLSVAGAAAAAAVFPLGMAAGRFVAPRLIARVPIISLGATLGAAGALGLAASSGSLPTAVALALAGLGIAVLYPVSVARLASPQSLGPHWRPRRRFMRLLLQRPSARASSPSPACSCSCSRSTGGWRKADWISVSDTDLRVMRAGP
jgi:hypothetical protein